MDELAFRSEPVVSFGQLLLIVGFIAGLSVLSWWLRKKGHGGKWLIPARGKMHRPELTCQIRRLDKDSSLYHLQDERFCYLVFRTASGAVLLDKTDLSACPPEPADINEVHK